MVLSKNSRKLIIAGLLGGLCLLIYLSFSYLNFSRKNEQWVIHTYQVLLHVEKLKFRIQQLYPFSASSERTRHSDSISLFRDRVKEAMIELTALRKLTTDNPVTQKLLLNKQVLLNKQIGSSLTTKPLSFIDTEYKFIERNELKLLNERMQKARKSDTQFKVLISITIAISSLAVLILLYGARQSITASDIMIEKIASSKIAYELLFVRIGEVLFSRDSNDQSFLGISITCESMFGYSANNFIHDKFLWFKIIHPDDRHQAISGRSRLENGESILNQYRILKQDGSIRWIEVSMVPFQDNGIGLKRIDGIARDITEAKLNEIERERMISELLDKNKSLELFGYELSHKVRAPLANVIALIALLKELPELSVAQNELMEHLEESVFLMDNRIIDLNALLSTKNI